MRLVPKAKSEKVAYFKARIGTWAQEPEAIGTTPQAVADLAEKVEQARAMIQRRDIARSAYLSAVLGADLAIAAMMEAGGDIITAIRAKAATGGNPVYEMARIDPPQAPTAVRTLGLPTDFKVTLGNDGALTLKWKCTNPRASGTVYQVWRSLDGGERLEFLATAGKKKFVDATLPPGAAYLVYQIQAVRSTAKGPIARFTVHLGGGMGAETFQAKHAA